jgi:nitrogen-specific signal transduction histidine kinase
MKTLNAYFNDIENLEKFIKDNAIEDSSKLLIQVFTHENNSSFIKNITNFFSKNFPLSSLIGSTTDGEIKDGLVSTNTTVISFTIFEQITLKTEITNQFDNHFQVGKDIASKIIQKDTKVIISFIDGLLGNGEEYIKGIESIDKNIIVAGGLAGDNAKFENTYVFTKEKIYTKGFVAVSLSSKNLNVNTDYSFNWVPIGQKLKITKSDKNVVYTINDRTALETYAYYLGHDISKNLPYVGIEFPLIVERNGIQIARAVIAKNDDGSLVFAGNLNVGDEVSFGYGNCNEILDKTQFHIDKISSKPVESIFIYSCMARRRFMPDKIEHETLIYNDLAPTAGFFTYGEFFSEKDNKELLNQSMTVLALSESENINNKKLTVDIKKGASSTVQALSHLIYVSTKELQKKDEIMISQSRNAAMGEMLNIVAHQWRQPLSSISMIANNALADLELDSLDNDSLEQYLKNIQKKALDLSNIINDFKNYFKPSDKKEEILLKKLFDDTKDIINANLENNNIELIIQENDKNIIVTVYKRELMQVLLNLINNSKEAFTSKEKLKKAIIISVKESNQNIIISVCDNAGGIDEKIIDEIFNPYFSTKNELNGTGLGLYMSKIIIEKYMQGTITAENRKYGACFNILLRK